MAYQYPYDEELRKTNLNPEMIRHRVRQEARQGMTVSLCISIPMLLLCAGVVAVFGLSYDWYQGVGAVILGLIPMGIFAFGAFCGVMLPVRTIRNHRRAARGEIRIEMDKLNYIEHDRPRVVYTNRRRRTVYEDFLHFASGREFCDPKLEYRHRNEEEETFIAVAYAAEPDCILFVYRLADYNWQP